MFRFGRPKIRVVPTRPLGRRDVFFSFGQVVRTFLLFSLFCAGWMVAASASARAQEATVSDAQFRSFVTGLWPDAHAAGVSRATFEIALNGVTPDPSVLRTVGKQAEFVKPIWGYVEDAVSKSRVGRGLARGAEFERTLARLEAQYGVDRYVVLAVWGMETNYGGFSGKMSTIRSLATLAAAKHRGAFFRNELIVALQILEQGHVAPQNMLGSWAGAMGQTQFMPSSFMKYAVDHDGDGHKDIWSSAPDALASTANYLAQHGWIKGWTWGYEIALPKPFSLRTHEPNEYRAFTQWAKAGVKRVDGLDMPETGEGALMLPAGRNGPAFLVTRNFAAIKSYNASNAYALGVSLLSDRLAGSAGLSAKWPVHERVLDANQSYELQRRLAQRGYHIGDFDGKIGEKAQVAIRHYQRQAGLEPDGFASVPLLERMRKAR
ncbi:MAG: lytic transglycosylase [Hyphomicrobiales bacterium]|nr:lytic transglycosylase [Hyphomicrobiales bacterium]